MRSGGRAAKGSETQRLCSEQKSPTRQGRLFKEDEMKITKELLREKGACAAGYMDFLKEFPQEKYPDGVEYQDLLDCCA